MENNISIQDVLNLAADFYSQNLTPEVRDYFRERNISEETLSKFKIGYASSERCLVDYLLNENKLSQSLCVKTGLIKQNQEGKLRDFFYDRIIFPNLFRGKVVHFTGRSFNSKEPKYLNLAGQIRHFYNEEATSCKEIYIAEGIPDCLTLIQWGFPSSAIFGCQSFKETDANKLLSCETVYLCLDPDESGRRGALRIAEMLPDKAKIIQLPEGRDINDYSKKFSRDDFIGLVNLAQDIVTYRLSYISQNKDKVELVKMLEPVLKILASMERAKVEAYLRIIKERFSLSARDVEGYRDSIYKRRKEEKAALKVQTTKTDNKPIYRASFNGLVDLVESEGSSAFIVKEADDLLILSSYKNGDDTVLPVKKESIPWLLPRGDKVLEIYNSTKLISDDDFNRSLFEKLVAYHRSISELPSQSYYDLLAAWDMHTYLLEKVQCSPVLCFFAIPERGKSRTGRGMIYLAYRGIHVESLNQAYIFRIAERFCCSLFFDVKDICKKAEKSGSEDLLLHRFEKGAKVPRVNPDKDGYDDITYYSIFGPTIIATNEAVEQILETRAISINMPETDRIFEIEVKPELALELKEWLLVFRARQLNKELQNINKPAVGRLGDILKPILQMILLATPEKKDSFLDLISQFKTDKLKEKNDTLEAQVLYLFINTPRDSISHGTIAVTDITGRFNINKPERYHISTQRIGRIIKSLGFSKVKTNNGSAAYVYNEDLIKRLCIKYGIETSVISGTLVNSLSTLIPERHY